MKSKGVAIGVSPKFSTGIKPTASYDTGLGPTVYAEFNGFAFNEMEFNGVSVGTGGQSAIPVMGVAVQQEPLWKSSTGTN